MTTQQAALAYRSVNHGNQTVQRILAAALACWSKQGYHACSLREIAKAAGVAKSLLHYHFTSKEHLLLELEALYYRQIGEAVRARLQDRPPSLESGRDALDQVWQALIATRREFPFALEIWRAADGNPAIKKRLDAFHEEMCTLIRDATARALGPLADALPMPVGRLAELLQVSFQGFSLQLYLTDDVARVGRAFEDFKMLVEGLLSTGATDTQAHTQADTQAHTPTQEGTS